MIKNSLSEIVVLGRTYLPASHFSEIVSNVLRNDYPVFADSVHLAACIKWLCNAMDVINGNGVSAGYYFRSGWLPAYPETTGRYNQKLCLRG